MDNSVNGWYGGNTMINNYGTISSITGGTFSALGTGVSANESYTANKRYLLVTYSDVTVSDITMDMDGAQNVMVYAISGTVSIDSGTYTIDADDTSSLFMTADGAYVAVSGGTFSSEVEPEYCADDFSPKANEDGTYTVDKVYFGISGGEGETIPGTIYSGEGKSVMFVKFSAAYIGTDEGYSTTAYPTTSKTYTPSSSADSGSYIFAGWFTDSEGENACGTDMWNESTECYAKFVDANTLSVECFFTPYSEKNALRFFTSQSQVYADAGFDLYIDNEAVENAITSVSYYSSSYSVGGTQTSPLKTYTPSTFGSAAMHIVTGRYYDTSKTTSFSVVPYWTTQDGTTIYGTETTYSCSGVTSQAVLTSSTN
ncbi:MAG: hypothetical protein LUD81_05660 [Clostridiales bacterium]|nr:hypothetical protein [Clostridiales bacterium]